MASLIEQLQADATSAQVPVTELLRRAKLIAAKLGLEDFRKWVDAELNGYSSDTEAPAYRKVSGTPMWLHQIRGWLPINFMSTAANDEVLMSNRMVTQPIGELENLVLRGGQFFDMTFSAGIAAEVSRVMGAEPTQVVTRVNQSQISGILDGVRNALLDWSIKLEQAGIIGEGLVFSHDERVKAQEPAVVYQIGHIENFLGHMGTNTGVSTVTATQNSLPSGDALRALIVQLRKHAPALELSTADSAKLESKMIELEGEAVSQAPDQGKVRRALLAVKHYAELATDKVLEIGINALIDRYLGPKA